MSKVQWPDAAYNRTGDDLSAPIQDLLHDLNLLECEKNSDGTPAVVSRGIRNTTPVTLQVITAGATSLSKVTASFVGAFGSLTAAVAAILAFIKDPGSSTPLMLVLVGSIAAVASATVLALALIVRGDLEARSAATAAAYQARAETAAALLHGFGSSRPASEPEPRYWTRTVSGEVYPVKGVVHKDGQILLMAGGKQLSGGEVSSVTPYAEWQSTGVAAGRP